MSSRSNYSVWPVVQKHFGALSADQSSTRIMFWMVFIPLALGAIAGGLVAGGMPIRNGVSQILAATALLVGAMLSLFVFITNLRVKVAESATYAFRTRLQKLLGGTAAGCLYVALIAFIVAIQLSLVASLPFLTMSATMPVSVGLVCATLVHLGVNLTTVIRRLFGTYYELFAADFDPEVDLIPDATEAEAVIQTSDSKPGPP